MCSAHGRKRAEQSLVSLVWTPRMNATKSLLATAILFALVSSQADLANGSPIPKQPPLARDSGAHQHYIVNGTQEGVLYDQTANYTGSGVISDDFDGAPTHDFDSYDSNGADDFVVTDPSGWTVTKFNFKAFGSQLPSDPSGDTVTVTIYPDNGGAPGNVPACSSPQSQMVFNAATSTAAVTLNAPCALPQGTYWVAMAFDATADTDMGFWGTVSNTTNNGALWQNPGGVYQVCPTYMPLGSCGLEGTDFAFQVIGAVGSADKCNSDGICLDVTLALADPDNPALCGTATSLSVDDGDQVNICYTVTNHSGIALNYQSLTDSAAGSLLSLSPQTIANGASYQYNRTTTVGASESISAVWTAQDIEPGYTPHFTPGSGMVADRVFCDGFDGSDCAGGDTSGFIDITQIGTQIDDDFFNILLVGNVTTPFSVNFYGNTTNDLCVSARGAIVVDTSFLCGVDGGNQNLPSLSVTGAGMMPLWDDFDVTSGHIYTATIGDTVGSRKYVIEWYNRVHFGGFDGNPNTDGATFEIVFDEASGTFAFVYDDVDYTELGEDITDPGPQDCSDGVCATIGLQAGSNPDSPSNTYSVISASLSDHSRLDWAPLSPNIFTSTATIAISAGAPVISVDPTTLTGSAGAGTSTTLPLTIGNSGDRDLLWNLYETPAADAMAQPRVLSSAPAGTVERVRTLNMPSPLAESSMRRGGQSDGVLGTAVPAFGQIANGSGGGDYYTFDVPFLQSFTPILTNFPQTPFYKAATFVAQDFSKQYMASTDPVIGNIATVSTTDGTITPLPQSGPPTVAGEVWWGLKYDNWTSTLYGLGCNADVQPYTCHLYTIDPTTGAITQGAALTGFEDPTLGVLLVDIAIDPSGQMYGVDPLGGDLIRINKTTGVGHVVGPTGILPNFAQGLDFDQSTGVLYWPSFDGKFGILGTIDLTTGALNRFVQSPEIFAFSIATSAGVCASPATVPWISFDVSSGTTSPTATSMVNVTLNAADLTAGVYSANVCVISNDRTNHLLPVPVQFTVSAPPIAH